MNYYYEEELTFQEQKQRALARKQQQKKQMLAMSFLLIASGAFYLFVYLPDKRKEAKEEIEETFKNNPTVQAEMLFVKRKNGDNEELINLLWPGVKKWEDYLPTLYLLSQLEAFVKNMTEAIENKATELAEEEKDLPRKMREEKIKAAKNSLEPEERDLPEIQRMLDEFIEKINQTDVNDLSTPKGEFDKLIAEKRAKRKRIYWTLPPHNWADRWLKRNWQSFNSIWDKMSKLNGDREPPYFDAKAIYRIAFPSALWNNLTEDQKQKAKDNGHGKLELRNDVWSYKFSQLVEEWRKRVKINPVRGEYNPNNPSVLDNNALFFGAPRTGKSVIAEIITHEANKYPLVIIQGSTLTPNKLQKELAVELLHKFIYTVCSITYDLVEDYGLQREVEDKEVRHILFIDEADQACTNSYDPPAIGSAQLTFLKECMGSDDKKEESKNLWIAATNHLSKIDIAIYQSGRLSNPLDFSWTLGIFNYYAQQAGIANQFPQHWKEAKTLNAEDNKWVNKFNKIIFDKDFLPFWRKFINNSDTRQELNEERDSNRKLTKKGIQWGEFFEFFWQLYDSKQLENSNGKWEKPRKPTIEEITEEQSNVMKETTNKLSTDLSKVIETRINELNNTVRDAKNILNTSNANLNNTISGAVNRIAILLTEIGNKIRS